MTDFDNRQEGFVVDGVLKLGHQHARFITPHRAFELARDALTAAGIPHGIPLQYFIGTAERENGFATNGRSIEAGGMVTDGLYQINSSEAPGVNLLDPVANTTAFVKLARRNLVTIRNAVPGEVKTPDVWAYLGLAHNQGLGAVRKTIAAHGCDWEAYKARNAKHPEGPRWARYGDACITGGARWAEALAL